MPRIPNSELEARENRIARLVAIQERLQILEEIAASNYSTELLALIRECYTLLLRAKREEIQRLHGRKEGLTDAQLDKLFQRIDHGS